MTVNLGGAILAEANLSFLGLGINPPMASWGGMVSDGKNFLRMNPIIAIAPGIFVLLIVLCFNIVGDAVRDALDPRLRGTL
jgi:peptide/nickel transport system permease protein